MPTTSNFGWTTPADTDLVKDGALAIRTLGNGIDTSMAQLKGGTTGQVLSKTSGTDMAFTWVTQDDANAIQNAIVDAKGDLIAATANDTPARLAVGNNGETLVANSSTSTGLAYTAGVGFAQPVINGGMDIWQRGTSIAQTAGANYTADRWQQGGDSPSSVTTTRQSTNDTTNLPFIQYCARVQRNSGSSRTTGIGLGTSIESVNSTPYIGRTVTLSFYMRAGSNFSSTSNALRARLMSSTTTDNNFLISGGTDVINQTITLTTSWQRFTYTSASAVSSSAVGLGIVFDYTPTGTAGANDFFEVTGVQVDLGSTALPFRRSGGTLAGELAACQRYYYKHIVTEMVAPAFASGTAIAQTALNFPVTMRVAPTITLAASGSSTGQIAFLNSTANYPTTIGTLVANRISVSTFTIYTTTATSAFTAGNASILFVTGTTQTVYEASAEL